MILGWFTFKIMSVSAVLYPRWPPLLKIETPSLVSIGLVVSEEKIFEKAYDVLRMPSDGNSSRGPLGQLS
jgi:hypothetical protein